jgi:hypothetical protein
MVLGPGRVICKYCLLRRPARKLAAHVLKTGECSAYLGIPQVGLKPRDHKNF